MKDHHLMASSWAKTIKDCAALIDAHVDRLTGMTPEDALASLETLGLYYRAMGKSLSYMTYHLKQIKKHNNVIPITRARKNENQAG